MADLDAQVAARLLSASADIVLVVEKGVIKDIAMSNADLAKEGFDAAWRGKLWADTVTTDCSSKISDLLKAEPGAHPHWRQVNHPSASGVDVPIKYTTVKAGKDGRIIALGRDLRAFSALQQRLVETHQDLEREYARLREAEARYKLLFSVFSEPVLVLDAPTMAIEDANPAAVKVLNASAAQLRRQPFPDFFAKSARRDIERVAAEALSAGVAEIDQAVLASGDQCMVTASAFREGAAIKLIVRIIKGAEFVRLDKTTPPREAAEIVNSLPDGLLVAGEDLRIILANQAFLEMTQLVGSGQAVGDRVSHWLGRSATELNMLINTLKSHGVVRNFTTILRDRFGNEEEVEISAIASTDDGVAHFGFAIRLVARRLSPGPKIGEALPRSVDQLTSLVGRMPLKDIVRESTDLIEKLCIEAALETARDNRASAAEILGLSRQGLYSKLKRFGIDDT
ncbi:MAG: transcriptional regulator PpsR [Pseudomonadota bacterium]